MIAMDYMQPIKRRKPQDDVNTSSRLSASPWTQIPHSFGSEQQWRHGADGSIMEIRKEKSRDAARSRRGKENFEFYELAKMLPLPPAITSQLDKASIIRLTISYLKLKEFTCSGDPPWNINGGKNMKSGLRHRTSADLTLEMFEQHQGTHILQSLDGFAFSLAADGRFLYISETVSIYLGLSQVEMTGSSVFDYIHQEDQQELADQLGLTLAMGQCLPSPSSLGSEDASVGSTGASMNPDVSNAMSVSSISQYKGYDRAFCIRMKSTLTKRGCHFKSSGFRVVLLLGHIRPNYSYTHGRKPPNPLLGFVCLAIALPPPTVHEVRLEPDMFVTRLNFDFRIAHCEPKASELLDYSAEELQGRSLYSLCHGQDTDKLRKCHQDLMKKGQVMSSYFRVLNKRGGYTWMQLCATIICNSKNGEEQNIICVNYIISRCVYDSLVLDESQLDPTLVSMKSDSMDFSTRASPDPTDMSRIRGEDTGGCSPVGGITPMCEDSPVPGQNLEPAPSSHRNSPETTAEGAPIKTEGSGSILTQAASSEAMDEARLDPVGRVSPVTRVSISPSSTPNGRASSSKTLTTLTPSSSLVGNSLRTEEGSVRELEAAMTRHLPEDAPDFSTNSLLRGSTSSNASGSRSTIQWVGGTSTQQNPSPASTLLRQLYANRESVIRTSVPRSYYSEVQSTLPTPPGHDGYQEPMFPKGHDFPYTTSGSLSSSISGVAMSGNYTDYHSAMTPPSSVSPREKMAGECNELRASSSYLGELGAGMPAQPLPLKPQVYSYTPSGLETPAYTSSLTDQSSSLYPSSSFHLYSSNSNKSSGAYDALRSGPPWYPSSS